jgi:hydroxyethylthiazole kinase-like uncharacterized protein yjeF
MSRHRAEFVAVDPDGLRSIHVSPPAEDGSKHDRGHVLVVGGSRETPGAVLLAADAAMRVGSGVVQVATAASVAPALGVALPETRVVPLDERNPFGALSDGEDRVAELSARADAVLVGTGTFDADSTGRLLDAVLSSVAAGAVVVVDAAGLDSVGRAQRLARAPGRVVLMPNPGEAARLVGRTPADVSEHPRRALTEVVDRFGTVVAVRGPETWISAPGEPHFRGGGGHPLLGVAGSGDVLAGALAGFAARGFGALGAAMAAVTVHARAGERLARDGATLGRPARELLPELPRLAAALDEMVGGRA